MVRHLALAACAAALLGLGGCSDDDFGQTRPGADIAVVVSTTTDMAVAATTGSDLSAVRPATDDAGVDMAAPKD